MESPRPATPPPTTEERLVLVDHHQSQLANLFAAGDRHIPAKMLLSAPERWRDLYAEALEHLAAINRHLSAVTEASDAS